MNKSKFFKILAVGAATLAAAGVLCVGAMALFSDRAKIYAGIKTTKLSCAVSQSVPLGVPASANSAQEAVTTVYNGATPLFSGLATDILDGVSDPANAVSYQIQRGNALSVDPEGSVLTAQTFSVVYANTSTVAEVFHPEIRLEPVNGENLSQYKNCIGIADATATPVLEGEVNYQSVLTGTQPVLSTVKQYALPSLVEAVFTNSDGSLTLRLAPFTLDAGKSTNRKYVLTLSMSGHLDYGVPVVQVVPGAVTRYADDNSALWYGVAEVEGTDAPAQYALGTDYPTRVLWQTPDGTYTVRGGRDAISVSDGGAQQTIEVLDYSVLQMEYTGTDRAPTAFLLNASTPYTLYRYTDAGEWAVADSAVQVGSYKAVVDASAVEGFAVSHTEFYFDITLPTVEGALSVQDTEGNLAMLDKTYDAEGADNGLVLQVNDAEGNAIDTGLYGIEFIWKDASGNMLAEKPKNAGSYYLGISQSAAGLVNGAVVAADVPFTISPAEITGKICWGNISGYNGKYYIPQQSDLEAVHHFFSLNLDNVPASEKDAITVGANETGFGSFYNTFDRTAHDRYFYDAKIADAYQNGAEKTDFRYAYYDADGNFGFFEGRTYDNGAVFFHDMMSNAAAANTAVLEGNYTFRVSGTEQAYTGAMFSVDYNADDAVAPSHPSSYSIIAPSGTNDPLCVFIDDDAPTRPGYKFKGFAYDKDATEPDFVVGDKYPMVSGKDTVLYVVWEEAEKPYIVRSGSRSALKNSKFGIKIYSDYSTNIQTIASRAVAAQFDDSVPEDVTWYTMRDNDSVVAYLDDENTLHICNNQAVTGGKQKPIAQAEALDYFFSGCTNLKTVDMSGLNISEVESMTSMFLGCSALESVKGFDSNSPLLKKTYEMFKYCLKLTDISGLQNLDVSSVISMYDMFAGCSSLEDLTPLRNWDVSSVTTFNNMFGQSYLPNNYHKYVYCTSLKSLDGLELWDTTSLTRTDQMFYGASALTDISALKNWKMDKVTTLYKMFQSCSSLSDISALSTWNVSYVTNFGQLFNGCRSLVSIDPLKNWNMGSANSLFSMFGGCASLADISPISGWDIGNVTSMDSLFYDCTLLNDVSPIAHWNTRNVTNMSSLFYNCTSLESVSLNNWNTSSVKQFYAMFFGCSSLKSAELNGWDTSSATSINSLFYGCSSLTDVAIWSWNTSLATNMYNVFYNCKALKTIDISGWNTSSATDMREMFSNCTLLNTIYASDGFVTANVTSSSNMFYQCIALVGGNGTVFDSSHIDATYAHIDTAENPGYFTDIADKPVAEGTSFSLRAPAVIDTEEGSQVNTATPETAAVYLDEESSETA